MGFLFSGWVFGCNDLAVKNASVQPPLSKVSFVYSRRKYKHCFNIPLSHSNMHLVFHEKINHKTFFCQKKT